jgi:hypothetical protein
MDDNSRAMIRKRTKTISATFKQALKEHAELTKTNEKERQEYLQSLVDDLKKRNNSQHITVKQLLHREKSRIDFGVIKKAMKPRTSKGIQYLDIPDAHSPNTWIRITNPTIIEDRLLTRNIEHFGQAKDTLFAKAPLSKVFGYQGVNQAATQIIEHGAIPEDIAGENTYINKFLDKLSSGKVIEVADTITFEEFKTGLQKWKEKTTTSPLGRHLGHYKLLLNLNIYESEQQKENLSESILKVYYNIAMTAIKLGQPVDRWKNITTCMIEKTPGVSRLDKLRVIHIFEADYNLILKIMWSRKAIWKIHNNNLLNDGQAGSHPGCRAIDVAIQKEMKYNYSKLTRTPLITVDNDAKSCFNRILCNVAMLVSQYYGITQNMCSLQAATLENTV